MRTRPLLTIVAITAFMMWTVVPVLAQTPSGQSAQPGPAANPVDTGKPGVGPGDKEKSEQTDMKGGRKAKKHARKSGGKPEAVGDEHGNKGGQERGLERADAVAGQHGQRGRDNARTKQ